MLYGNLIFIKKTGGDGSKFPVTERNIKIGRSEDCLIRIYNTQVAPEHCQLIIEDNGQMTLRNLSKETVLNGKPLGQGDVTLCHGDIFKVGERLARWEYLPTSKYYRQLLSPTGRLVAVVMPQQRSMGEQATPGTSASHISVLKNTPLGKRRYSERGSSEALAVKIRKSSGTDISRKSRGDLPKFLTGRHSLKTTKLLMQGAKVKERKSISGTISSKTPKGKAGGKSRKSTLPSWKVNIASPSKRKSTNRNSPTKSSKKSGKSPKRTIKTQLTDVLDSESSQKLLLPISKSGLKTPQKKALEALSKSASKSISKTPLKAIRESPTVKNEGSLRSSRSLSKSPSSNKKSPKSPTEKILSTPKPKPPKLARLVHSETKLNARAERQEVFPKANKRMSLIVKKLDSTPARSFKKLHESVTPKKAKMCDVVSSSVTESPVGTLLDKESPVNGKQTRKSVKGTPAKKTPGKTAKTPRKSSIQKTPKNPTEKVKTPRKSVIIQTPRNLTQSTSSTNIVEVSPEVMVKTPLLIDLNSPPSSRKAKYTPRKSTKSTPNVKLNKSVEKIKLSASRNISVRQNENSVPASLDISAPKSRQRSTSPRGRKSEIKEASLKATADSPKVGTSSPRGVRRKLSPSSSAERAAKMLKTSSPRKPDKNKKAALLVLGKANRKQLLSQNVKVLLKQKIVKKAIKQSSALTSQKGDNRRKTATKVKKVLRKTALKSKKKPTGKNKISPSKNSRPSEASTIKSPVIEKTQEVTPRGRILHEPSQPSALKTEASPTLSSKGKSFESSSKSPSKQNKKTESPRSVISFQSSAFSISPSGSYDKTAESYLFNSNRRSKRLSSKNDMGRPDFIELSPTALGLMPKNVNIFKTPKENKRRSSSLVTPKSVRSSGIIKSASTSKIGNRKSVRFSSKDVSYNSDFQSPVIVEKVDFDFSSYHTPDVTVDMFVSPLTDKSSVKKDVNESKSIPPTGESSKISPTKVPESSLAPKTCVRKLLQSPKNKGNKVSPVQKSLLRNSRVSATKSPSQKKLVKASKAKRENKSPKNDLGDLKGVRQLFVTPKTQKSPKNDLTDVKGIKKLFQTPKVQKSPKNELVDVRGVKKLLQTPKVQKSPKNDLTDVRGVKKILKTPKVQKSPKNDLSDLRGVKKILQTPKVQKSPKNDLTDVQGVKKLLQTPKVQKSPKNDLTDVRGVKKLLQTPKVQKSPKNDLTDVRGVKKLLQTPRTQKSPKNDLTDVRGVKKLLQTPKAQRSPKNDLTDVVGVKELFRSHRVQKSPKNDLSDLRGVKKLLGSPKVQKSPKSDFTDVTGVKKLFTTPGGQKSPKNNLLEVSGLGNLFDSPEGQKVSRNSAADMMKVLVNSSKPEGNLTGDARNVTGVNQLLITKSPESLSKSKKTVSRKSHVNDYKAIRGRRTIYSTPKGPKNDLSDLIGVRELFSRHKPTSDYNVSLTGVAELFDLPNSGVDSTSQKGKPRGKSMQPITERKTPARRTLKSKKEVENEDEKDDKTVTRRGRLKKAAEEETEKKVTRSGAAENLEEKKSTKRKAAEIVKTNQAKKPSGAAKKSETVIEKETKTVGKKSQARPKTESSKADEVVKGSRKRKVMFEESETTPAKTRRKLPAAENVDSGVVVETSRRAVSRSAKETVSGEKSSVKRVKGVSAKAKDTAASKTSSKVQSKTAIKNGTKQTEKVQNRSQSSSKAKSSDSKAKASPRKTRSAKSEAVSKTVKKNVSKAQKKTVGKKVVKATAGRGKTSPVVKRSTRRK